ncbi:hypothetical protein H0H92_009401 [Tricholoma furcatifolium]|nr:hypothetical protein H0H92_009401 [Tricholoma furcatifolium]
MAPPLNHPPGVTFVEERAATTHTVDAATYYGGGESYTRSRTYSHSHIHGYRPKRAPAFEEDWHLRPRRLSHDEKSVTGPRRFLIDVEETIRVILEQEDTDGDFQISVTDAGPKMMALGTATSNGFKTFDIRGTYMLSNLLQELALARDHNRKRIVLDEARLTENPVDRLSRMIKNSFWHSLTRRIDGDGLEIITADPKNRTGRVNPRIYVPHGEPAMADYYRRVAKEKPHMNLDVQVLPEKPDDPAFVKSLNNKPGILALAMNEIDDGKGGKTLKGIPFIVPGARFNELYNWDSYFISLGLLVDGQVSMAKGMVDHFIFEIKHYGKILNGNRSYYLCRTQPPFLTDMALQIYNQLDQSDVDANREWLKRAIQAAIKEYHTVWVAEPRIDLKTGLSRYRPDGLGIPPETEATHFTQILEPFARKHGISVLEFSEKYNDGSLKEPELDEYFLHDRAVRESGHDTTYRFEKRCANLATIDLQSLLYKYEVDIGTAIREVFDDELELDEDFDLAPFPPSPEAYANPRRDSSKSRIQRSDEWFDRADFRKDMIDKYLWNEQKSLFFDYDTVQEKQILYESVTSFWPLWAGCASDEQAWKLVTQSLRKFEVLGGVVSGTEESRGKISLERPNRQWDYPPPHQIMAWVGLERYGYLDEAQRLAYRFLYMMTTAFVDFNGVVPEKFDAVKLSHLVDAEYGNQGIDFKLVPREGFGWMNSAYQVGLTFMTSHMRRAVAACTSPEVFFGSAATLQPPMLNADMSAVDPLGLAMEHLSVAESATLTSFLVFLLGINTTKPVPPPQALKFELRHLHAVSHSSHVIFSDVPLRTLDTHSNERNPLHDTYTIRTRQTTSFRPPSFQAFSDARTHSLRFGQSQSLPWDEEDVIGPDVERRETLLELAKMTNNAYVDPLDKDWYDLGGGWNVSYSFGWAPDADGMRGHVFATPDNKTVILSIKGTSAGAFGSGGPTAKKDKLNDNLFPDSNIWVIGHSLGGALATLLGATFGAPAVAFESPGERLASHRLHLPSPPSTHHITHVYHSADPIAMGTCNGVLSSCALAGYAMEARCHLGKTIFYDTVTNLSWAVDIRTHGIVNVIEKVLSEPWPPSVEKGREVPEPHAEDDCVECFSWDFGDYPASKGAELDGVHGGCG